MPAVTAQAALPACTVEHSVTGQWDNGFQGAVKVTDNSAPVSSWNLTFDFSGGQKVDQGWNAAWSRSGTTVTAADESWNGSPATGASVSAGFLASWSGSNAAPTAFRLSNEPYPDRAASTATQAWQCRRDGGTCPGIGYGVAGRQDLVGSVRATGAANPILLGGPACSNHLGQWPAYKPTDPAGNLVAAYHVYTFRTCASESCWNSALAPVAAQVPLVAGEIGENTCAHGFIDQVMKWFDDRDLSCLGRTWDTWNCAFGPSLISDYAKTPTAFGTGLRDHLRAVNP